MVQYDVYLVDPDVSNVIYVYMISIKQVSPFTHTLVARSSSLFSIRHSLVLRFPHAIQYGRYNDNEGNSSSSSSSSSVVCYDATAST